MPAASLAHARAPPTHEVDPFNMSEVLAVGAVSFVFFLLLGVYLTKTLNALKKNDEYGARVCSFIHAVISVAGSGYAMYEHEGGWFDTPTTRLEADWMMFSFAYFAADTVLMMVYAWDWLYAGHHLVTMACCGSVAFYPHAHWAFSICFATCGGEITNMFMHPRWILAAEGLKHSALCKWLTRLWFVTFFLLRFFGAPFVVYHMVMQMPFYFAPLSVSIMVLSWTFFVNAVNKERAGEWWSG